MIKTKRIKTLADHAEAWWKKQGKDVAPKGTDEYQAMYKTWAKWAFDEFISKGEHEDAYNDYEENQELAPHIIKQAKQFTMSI